MKNERRAIIVESEPELELKPIESEIELRDLLDSLGCILALDAEIVELDVSIIEEQTLDNLIREEYLGVREIW